MRGIKIRQKSSVKSPSGVVVVVRPVAWVLANSPTLPIPHFPEAKKISRAASVVNRSKIRTQSDDTFHNSIATFSPGRSK